MPVCFKQDGITPGCLIGNTVLLNQQIVLNLKKMKKLTKTKLRAITGGSKCQTECRQSLNTCKAIYAGTPNIELCWDQFFICFESCQ
jgi:hypothetical protein